MSASASKDWKGSIAIEAALPPGAAAYVPSLRLDTRDAPARLLRQGTGSRSLRTSAGRTPFDQASDRGLRRDLRRPERTRLRGAAGRRDPRTPQKPKRVSDDRRGGVLHPPSPGNLGGGSLLLALVTRSARCSPRRPAGARTVAGRNRCAISKHRSSRTSRSIFNAIGHGPWRAPTLIAISLRAGRARRWRGLIAFAAAGGDDAARHKRDQASRRPATPAGVDGRTARFFVSSGYAAARKCNRDRDRAVFHQGRAADARSGFGAAGVVSAAMVLEPHVSPGSPALRRSGRGLLGWQSSSSASECVQSAAMSGSRRCSRAAGAMTPSTWGGRQRVRDLGYPWRRSTERRGNDPEAERRVEHDPHRRSRWPTASGSTSNSVASPSSQPSNRWIGRAPGER